MKTFIASVLSYFTTGYAIAYPNTFDTTEKALVFLTAGFITVLHVLADHKITFGIIKKDFTDELKLIETRVSDLQDKTVQIKNIVTSKNPPTTPIS
jgi:Ni,Fe-hydrogenase I cytochrome b subunit